MEEDIPNTFAPNVGNKHFTIDAVFRGLQFGGIKEKDLPDDVKKRLHEYLEEKSKRKKHDQSLPWPDLKTTRKLKVPN